MRERDGSVTRLIKRREGGNVKGGNKVMDA